MLCRYVYELPSYDNSPIWLYLFDSHYDDLLGIYAETNKVKLAPGCTLSCLRKQIGRM
jgi:hypothetical protein